MKRAENAGRVIRIVSNQIKRQLDDTVPDSTFTGAQGRFLHFILASSGGRDVFQRDLEEEFHLRRSTATGILQLMEKNDLLYREGVDYDARLKKIVLTEKGVQLKGQVADSLRRLEERLCRNLERDDLDTFFRVMEQMSKNLE